MLRFATHQSYLSQVLVGNFKKRTQWLDAPFRSLTVVKTTATGTKRKYLKQLSDLLKLAQQALHEWRSARRRRSNLKIILKLDTAVLRDVGLTKADIAALSDVPLSIGRSSDSYYGLLSFENNLRLSQSALCRLNE